jgi:hypothetical protein
MQTTTEPSSFPTTMTQTPENLPVFPAKSTPPQVK